MHYFLIGIQLACAEKQAIQSDSPLIMQLKFALPKRWTCRVVMNVYFCLTTHYHY